MRDHLIIEDGRVASVIRAGRALVSGIVEFVDELGVESTQVVVLCQPSTRDIAETTATAFAGSGRRATGFTLPDGEEAKQMGVVEDVYRHLNTQRFTRRDLIVAIGGGALTDTAGFVAGTYLRGVDVVYVPTTLLGAVDAAIGGKTGVNVDGKNLAGVFRHPRAVAIDIDVLDGLPPDLIREGSAEAIKTGMIADPAIVEAYEADRLGVDLDDVVNRSVAVKVAVVNDDFTEDGRRAILNYGHTVGHAIETSTGRSHGASVAIGMHAAAAASAQVLDFGELDRQEAVLRGIGLETTAPDAHAPAIRSLMALDKKRDASGLRMVLLRDIGQPEVHTVDDATVRAALTAIGVD
ncbi:MAG: 3-dehydroquinate synthase family protein [Acidimicrobiia bacterium]|nr:3-dehydroquinate synthase family protein [Acidimicrobiia bacterium]